MGETAEQAVVREIGEELGVTPRIVRPLWLNQAFFTEDVDRLRHHELCVYFLLDVSDTGLDGLGDSFTLREGEHTHMFEWIPFERLKDEYFYPGFLKTEIGRLANIQKWQGKRIREAGCRYRVVKGMDQAREFVEELKDEVRTA